VLPLVETQIAPNSINYHTPLVSVPEPDHFYAAPAPGKIFDADPAPAATVPTLLNCKAKFLKRSKFKHMLKVFCSFDAVRFMYNCGKYELNVL
jgi:hypothetical protein